MNQLNHNKTFHTITAIILVGGESTRMGTNKALLQLNGKTLIEHTIELMQNCFQKVILVTNQHEQFQFMNINCYEDIYKDCGPLAGIHSGLFHSTTENNFVIACDYPYITREVINILIQKQTEKQITIPAIGKKIHPLCGIYSRSCLPAIEKILSSKNEIKRHTSVMALIDALGAEVIELNTFFSNECLEKTFLNLNTHQELKKIV
jgi:molybdopterin-guanine dinucleotide biosynthesis protein A